jgi:chemotaxis protein MotB
MGPKKKQPEPEESPGAPEWLVTFSDCMTLLLTFFVLLLTFSSFDKEVFENLQMIFADGLPSIGLARMPSKDAFLLRQQIDSSRNVDEGSEKPTLEQGKEDGQKKQTELLDFRGRKVFLISSEKVFWGRGTTVSRQGHEVLTAVGAFLRHMPGRIVISENGLDDAGSGHFGLPRAYAVMDYLVTEQKVDQNRFSLSASTTLPRDGFKSGESGIGAERKLEIVLLERSICN